MNKVLIFLGIVAWVVFAIVGMYVQNFPETLRYLFLLRVPILTGLFLVLFPIIATNRLQSMLKNLFLLRTEDKYSYLKELVLVSVSTITSGIAITSVFHTMLMSASIRFGLYEATLLNSFQRGSLAICLGLPMIIKAIKVSWEDYDKFRPYQKTKISRQDIKYITEIIWGLIISLFISILFISIINYLENSSEYKIFIQQIFQRIISIIPENVRIGYILSETGEIAPGMVSIITAILFILLIYVSGYYLSIYTYSEAELRSNRFEVPEIFYLNLIVSMFVLILGGMTFFLDYSRVPTFVIIILVSISSYFILDVEHYYYIKANKEDFKQPQVEQWKQAVLKRLNNQAKTLVIVNASGGGIQAAGWTSQVLTGLDEELGSDFTNSIGWISAVSGGSVGTMFYLDRLLALGKENHLDKDEQEAIFQSATRNSLAAIAWGLAYPDLWRLIGLGFPCIREDRGTAIEMDWKRGMKDPNASLNSWYTKIIEEAKIPIPIFNATLVEDGRRFLISPMTFKSQNDNEYEKYKCTDFRTLYPGYDLSVITAARLSATFPYVSPICRPIEKIEKNGETSFKEPPNIFHVGDGGYFDNFGVFTSIQLLDNLLESHPGTIEKVIFLRINAFPENSIQENEKNDKRQDNFFGWRMAILGTFDTVYKVRSSTQNASINLAINSLQEKWSMKNVKIKDISIAYPTPQGKKFQPPLSWKLTENQKKDIKDAWENIKENIIGQIKS